MVLWHWVYHMKHSQAVRCCGSGGLSFAGIRRLVAEHLPSKHSQLECCRRCFFLRAALTWQIKVNDPALVVLHVLKKHLPTSAEFSSCSLAQNPGIPTLKLLGSAVSGTGCCFWILRLSHKQGEPVQWLGTTAVTSKKIWLGSNMANWPELQL